MTHSVFQATLLAWCFIQAASEILVVREAGTGKVTISYTGTFANKTDPGIVIQPDSSTDSNLVTMGYIMGAVIACAILFNAWCSRQEHNGHHV